VHSPCIDAPSPTSRHADNVAQYAPYRKEPTMHVSRCLLLAALLPLAACSTSSSSTNAVPPADASAQAGTTTPPQAVENPYECQQEKLEAFAGKTADEATVQQLVGDSGARNARVVKPGMAVTMDFRQDRVTVQVDEQNRIVRASCG